MKPGTRKALIGLIILNVLAAAGTYAVASLLTGLGRGVVMSKYRDLQRARVITVDPQALRQYKDGMFADADPEDWPLIPDYLTEGYEDAITVALFIAAIFLANAVVLAFVLTGDKDPRPELAHAGRAE